MSGSRAVGHVCSLHAPASTLRLQSAAARRCCPSPRSAAPRLPAQAKHEHRHPGAAAGTAPRSQARCSSRPPAGGRPRWRLSPLETGSPLPTSHLLAVRPGAPIRKPHAPPAASTAHRNAPLKYTHASARSPQVPQVNTTGPTAHREPNYCPPIYPTPLQCRTPDRSPPTRPPAPQPPRESEELSRRLTPCPPQRSRDRRRLPPRIPPHPPTARE